MGCLNTGNFKPPSAISIVFILECNRTPPLTKEFDMLMDLQTRAVSTAAARSLDREAAGTGLLRMEQPCCHQSSSIACRRNRHGSRRSKARGPR